MANPSSFQSNSACETVKLTINSHAWHYWVSFQIGGATPQWVQKLTSCELRTNFRRDHHPRCFTMWMAGGGVKGGMVYGETDELGYNVVQDGVHVHDIQATIFNQLGPDHEAITYKFEGRRYRLTDVHCKVVKAILS